MLFLLSAVFILFSLAILSIGWATYKIWEQNYKEKSLAINDRIQSGYEILKLIKVDHDSFSASSKIEKYLQRIELLSSISKKLNQSSSKVSVIQFLGFSSAIGISFFILFIFFQLSIFMALIFAIMMSSLPYVLISYRYAKLQTQLERQLPDILDFIARSMQAGHDFNSALRLAAQESPEPIAHEFQMMFDEINFGGLIHHAMAGLSGRIDCPDVRYFAIAVLINREIGGDISLLLKNVSTLIRDRITFKDTVYAMTAEGRVSAMILGAMPFLIGILIYLVNPGFVNVLWTDPTGQKMFIYALLLMIFGGLWMYRMVQIKV
jgi:tight adherence protein B